MTISVSTGKTPPDTRLKPYNHFRQKYLLQLRLSILFTKSLIKAFPD